MKTIDKMVKNSYFTSVLHQMLEKEIQEVGGNITEDKLTPEEI